MRPTSGLAPNSFAAETLPMVKPTGFREYDARWLFPAELNLLGAQVSSAGSTCSRRAGRMDSGAAACGHDDAYALKTKIVYECVACRKQHSLLAGTIFEQTKTGLGQVVPGHLPGDVQQGRDRRHRAQAAAGLGQLPEHLDLAARNSARP